MTDRLKGRTLADSLYLLGPCSEGMEWARQWSARAKQRAWDECPRGDWLLWVLDHCGTQPDLKLLARAAADCARVALDYQKGSWAREVIEGLEGWIEGKFFLCSHAAPALDNADYAALHASQASRGLPCFGAALYASNASVACLGEIGTEVMAAHLENVRAVARRRCADAVRRTFPKPPRIRRLK